MAAWNCRLWQREGHPVPGTVYCWRPRPGWLASMAAFSDRGPSPAAAGSPRPLVEVWVSVCWGGLSNCSLDFSKSLLPGSSSWNPSLADPRDQPLYSLQPLHSVQVRSHEQTRVKTACRVRSTWVQIPICHSLLRDFGKSFSSQLHLDTLQVQRAGKRDQSLIQVGGI